MFIGWISLPINHKTRNKPKVFGVFIGWIASWGPWKGNQEANHLKGRFLLVTIPLWIACSRIQQNMSGNLYFNGGLVDIIPHLAMGRNLCLHFGANGHPCTTSFDVHQDLPGFRPTATQARVASQGPLGPSP